MDQILQRDILLSHGVVNYLNASYRGKYVFLNILAQLNYRNIRSEEIARTEKSLEAIERWARDLYKGMPLLATAWTTIETFDGKRSIDMLEQMKPDLNNAILEIERIVAKQNYEQEIEDVKFLIAVFGRFAYARDNYVKGLIEFNKTFDSAEAVLEMNEFQAASEQNLTLLHDFLKAFKAGNLAPGYFAFLKFKAQGLPPIFRTHIHELNQMTTVYKGEFTYERAQIGRIEGQKWMQIGADPLAAGYWRAYQITPNEAQAWTQIGILDPAWAYEWKQNGFSIEEAQSWVLARIAPDLARKWALSGYTAANALEMIRKGIINPAA